MSDDSKKAPEQPEVSDITEQETSPATEEVESPIDVDSFVQAQVKALEDEKVRLQAEIQNMRKRHERDISHAHKFAVERCVQDLIPVIDSLAQGIDSADSAENREALVEGMNLTLKLLIESLSKHGVEEVDPQGQAFDPGQHEAMSMQAIEGQDSGTVLNVFQKGYTLNGRVIRPARVIVAK